MKLLPVICVMALSACQGHKENKTDTDSGKSMLSAAYPEVLVKAMNAHGGLDQWKKQQALSFDLRSTVGDENQEHQLIDMNSRKVLITGSGYTIGMDGKQVWVAPDKQAFSAMPPRFYHNLIFYFFSMPFVLADPGIQYEDLGERTVNGKVYKALKISFNNGVGDSDKDLYIAHFDPETYQLKLLLYTVTYFSKEQSDKFNALMYTEWQRIDGLLVPRLMQGYQYAGDTLGQMRYGTAFSNITFSTTSPDPKLFMMPQKAEIDSL